MKVGENEEPSKLVLKEKKRNGTCWILGFKFSGRLISIFFLLALPW
jgi:hypothetical protein